MRNINWSFILVCSVLLIIEVVGCGSSTAVNGNNNDGAAGTGGRDGGALGGNGGSTSTGSGGSGGGGGSGLTGSGGTGATDAAPLICAPGASCTSGDSCTTTNGCGGGRDRACFCDQNDVLACENCQVADGGTGGTAGTDAGANNNACPSGVATGMACTTQGTFCRATCTNNQAQACFCTRKARADGGGMTWNCLQTCTVP